MSNRVAWPYQGSRLDQPVWVLHNFRMLDALSELFKLEKKRPNVAGLLTIGEVFGDMAAG